MFCICYYHSKQYCSLCRTCCTCCCRRLVIVESRWGQAQESELRAPALVLEASAAHGHKPRRVRRRLAIVHREHLVVRDRVPAPVGEPGGAHVPVPVARALPRAALHAPVLPKVDAGPLGEVLPEPAAGPAVFVVVLGAVVLVVVLVLVVGDDGLVVLVIIVIFLVVILDGEGLVDGTPCGEAERRGGVT